MKAAASGQSFHRQTTLRQHLAAAQERVRAMGDPREEEGDRRTRAARQRAAREKVERLQQALEELKKVQAAPEGRAEPAERRARETDPEARHMRQGDGGSAPRHNVQISTDAARALSLARSVGGIYQRLAEGQTGVAAVLCPRPEEGALRGLVGVPDLQPPAMVPAALECAAGGISRLNHRYRAKY